jgi:hypothetical protein
MIEKCILVFVTSLLNFITGIKDSWKRNEWEKTFSMKMRINSHMIFKIPRNEISFLYSQKKYSLNKFSKLETDTL